MSEERIKTLEDKQGKIEITLSRMEQSLENISTHISKALEMRDETIILKQKCEAYENTLNAHIQEDKIEHREQNEKIFKYAMMATGTSATLSILIPIIMTFIK